MIVGEWVAIGIGAAFGAWVRWGLGLLLNAMLPVLTLGTIVANLVGGYLIGLAVATFALVPSTPPEIRLFVITGFLGGMTTFSAFSAEGVDLLMHGQYGWAVTHIMIHVAGSLLMTGLGMLTIQLIRG